MAENVADALVKLILRRNIQDCGNKDDAIGKLLQLTHVRLDRESLHEIPRIPFLPSVTNLYLQQNNITVMENLTLMPNLRFLTLSDNKISALQGIKDLFHLRFLDLGNNCIQTCSVEELPLGLVILNMKNNPCTDMPHYVNSVSRHLPKLKVLDGSPVEMDSDSEDDEIESDNEHKLEKLDNKKCAPEVKVDLAEKNDTESLQKIQHDISETISKFSTMMNENEMMIRNEFMLPDTHRIIESDAMSELCSIVDGNNKETANRPLSFENAESDDGRHLSPHPPLKTKHSPPMRTVTVVPKQKQVSTQIRIRTPGARPIKRVLN